MCTTRGFCRGHRKLLGCRESPDPPLLLVGFGAAVQRICVVFPTVHRVGATPVPIPNTEVKPRIGDGTAGFTGGRVARRWDPLRNGVRSRPGAVSVSDAPLLCLAHRMGTLVSAPVQGETHACAPIIDDARSVWLAKTASPQSNRMFVSIPCRTTKTSGPSAYSGIRCAIQGLEEAGSNQNERRGTRALASREKTEPKSGP